MSDLVRDRKTDLLLRCVKEQGRKVQDPSTGVSVKIGCARVGDGVSVRGECEDWVCQSR
jgi:hypothetical protein